jgi:hypothetical protein
MSKKFQNTLKDFFISFTKCFLGIFLCDNFSKILKKIQLMLKLPRYYNILKIYLTNLITQYVCLKQHHRRKLKKEEE